MNPSVLFHQHVVRHIALHRSRLRDLFAVIDEGEIPDANEPEIESYLGKLKAHLAETGKVTLPDFLLLYCLTVPGSYRGIRPRVELLGPNRGGFSKRRLEEAAAVAEKLAQMLAFAALIPSFDFQTLVPSLKSLLELTESAPLRELAWVQAHVDLSEDEAQILGELALGLLDRSREDFEDLAGDVFGALADYRSIGLGPLTEALANRQFFWPHSIYRGGTDAAADSLCKFLDIRNGAALTQVVFSLAWFNTGSVMADFERWVLQKQDWVDVLNWDLSKIPRFAGWEVSSNGKARTLIHAACHQVVSGTVSSADAILVPCRSEANVPCVKCNTSMSWLFDFSAVPAAFWNERFGNAPRRILYCSRCAVFGPFYSTYEESAMATFLDATCEHLEPLEDRPLQNRFLELSPFPTYALTKAFALDDATSVGGMPSWLQNPDYPVCLKCHESMRYIAQFDCGSIKHEEGMFYAFYCDTCHVAAVNYQQT